jgi:hypothetical protein
MCNRRHVRKIQAFAAEDEVDCFVTKLSVAACTAWLAERRKSTKRECQNVLIAMAFLTVLCPSGFAGLMALYHYCADNNDSCKPGAYGSGTCWPNLFIFGAIFWAFCSGLFALGLILGGFADLVQYAFNRASFKRDKRHMVTRDLVLFQKPESIPDYSGKKSNAACIVYVDALACYYSSPDPESTPSLTTEDAKKGDWLFGMQLVHSPVDSIPTRPESPVWDADWRLKVIWLRAVTERKQVNGRKQEVVTRWDTHMTHFPIEGTAKAQEVYHWLNDSRRRSFFRFQGAAKKDAPNMLANTTAGARPGNDRFQWPEAGTLRIITLSEADGDATGLLLSGEQVFSLARQRLGETCVACREALAQELRTHPTKLVLLRNGTPMADFELTGNLEEIVLREQLDVEKEMV